MKPVITTPTVKFKFHSFDGKSFDKPSECLEYEKKEYLYIELMNALHKNDMYLDDFSKTCIRFLIDLYDIKKKESQS